MMYNVILFFTVAIVCYSHVRLYYNHKETRKFCVDILLLYSLNRKL